MASQANWEADKMLDVYIYDYLLKRNLQASAKAFQAEGKVSTDPVAIDAPGGFLFEWWSVFWDIFIARTNEKHSEAAASYIETQVNKAREQQQKPPQNPQMQMQQLLQRHAAQQQQQQQPQQQQQQLQLQQHQHQQQHQQQQQRRDGTQLLNGASNGLVGTESVLRQNSATANAMTTKMYEDRLKPPLQRDALDDATMKQRLGDNNMSQLMDSNRASMVKVASAGGQSPGQMLHGTPGGMLGNLQQAHNRSQQHPGLMPDIKTDMMNPRAAGSEGSLMGLHGSNESSSNLTLKGWPLTVRPGILQQQNSMSSQPFNQFQIQQQLLLQAQQNLASPSGSDLETRRLAMLLNRSMSNVDVPNAGSPVQVGCPVLPGPDADMLMKLQQQHLQNNNQHQQQQQYSQHQFPGQHPQSSNQHLQQQDKIVGAGSMSNSFQGSDQVPKNQMGRKRKQPVSSSGPANSSGTGNTAGPSHPDSPSTPSTHTAGDVISMPTLGHNGGSSKSLLMFGSDALGPVNDVDRFVDDGSLEDNVESFLSHDDADPRDRVARCSDVSKGLRFQEFGVIPASASKVECCHFSADGKTLATGGHDRKAVLWCTESFKIKSTLEEHTQWITDVRFSPSMSRLATSSADKTVRVWDVDNVSIYICFHDQGYSLATLRNFMGHSTTVMSLDFHPTKEDLLCSCDNNSEIRYWSIKNGSCAGVFKGGATQVRFQPHIGRMLAAAGDNIVSVLDVETQVCTLKLQGHKNLVNSVCWDSSGEYLASVSDDSVRVWTVGSSSQGECLYELSCSGNKFRTCVFHPAYPSLLVVGCYETLELWNMTDNKTMSLHAHDKLVSCLAASSSTGVVASASHDKTVKLWK